MSTEYLHDQLYSTFTLQGNKVYSQMIPKSGNQWFKFNYKKNQHTILFPLVAISIKSWYGLNMKI